MINPIRVAAMALVALGLAAGTSAPVAAQRQGHPRPHPRLCSGQASISGQVTLAESGDPVEGATVVAVKLVPHRRAARIADLATDDVDSDSQGDIAAGSGRGPHPKPAPVARAQTDAEGNYTLSGLCAGKYVVYARAEGVGRGAYDSDDEGTKPDILTLGADVALTDIDIALTTHQQP
jgi:hypothetical protein